ncbi:RNA methyltransferase [Adlercreutzia sp. R21]|uniref:TrmH family RNA methyltransferase n=1 Tax=Adlercreutzia wanghongyangiae TaxID=3111451 RepID=UPI002DBC841A|nr:RNA methyltransferase [Adlercreutzia sp. R21]MEC4185208.1 RNA methyltransferase [Adlercreutzia sp. R21]
MPLIYVDALDDPRLDAYARLTEAQLRSKLEPERAIFIAESEKVIERAFEGGMEPLSLLMEEKWLDAMAPLIARMEERAAQRPGGKLPVFVAPHDELKRLTGFELTRGALGAFRRPTLPALDDVLRKARLVAVLEDITNHTNVGAIFRSAAALGVDAVLVSPACYDPLYRRAVRVSMGTVFQVPWTRIGDEGAPNRPGCGTWSGQGIAELHDRGFTIAAMALSDESVAPDELNALLVERAATDGTPAKLALLFGTEGEGLAPATIARCDYTVRIPMAHGVDSLNVAASSAVAFYAFRQLSQLGRKVR